MLFSKSHHYSDYDQLLPNSIKENNKLVRILGVGQCMYMEAV